MSGGATTCNSPHLAVPRGNLSESASGRHNGGAKTYVGGKEKPGLGVFLDMYRLKPQTYPVIMCQKL